MLVPQPACDLLRRPIILQLTRNDSLQRQILREQAGLGATSCVPGCQIGLRCAIASAPAVPGNFLADREGARFKLLAMPRTVSPAAMPREISSRSARLSTLAERRRTAGAIPPVALTTRCTAVSWRPRTCAMPRTDSPALYLRQISAHWASVNVRCRLALIEITSYCYITIEVFRRSVETAPSFPP